KVAKLKEELRKQSDLKETYKARLENAQQYLRFCLEVAQEHGFLHLMSNDEERPPHRSVDEDAEAATATDDEDGDEEPESIEAPPRDPYLAATRDLAVQHGWSVAPDEIELHETIGRGTTAEIHRATWRGLEVAVKWIRPELLRSNPSAEAFFAQELDVLSRQRHPHVLRLMGACLRPPESCFLVTELLSGATLVEWLHGGKERRRKELPPARPLAQRVGRALEVALAMRHLHEQTPRVLHRDLKPSNVLLDADSRARVADFGHARFLPDGAQALTGETGTYVYMAPEVIRCEPYTEKCDVYSFGVMLNELVTGEHPYIDTSYGPSKIALEVADGKLRPRLPEGDADAATGALVDLICRAWYAEPSRRPSFAAITVALRGIQEQLV
uniref:Protein kinase domain-containing protein n=2 Tax=Aegilops tauschii subsp. strangulata TaxID=200361 RepID=A0A453KTF8_AEGTS